MPADAIATDAAPREVRLADYKPPAFLIDTVDLAFDLDEAATRVVSRLALRRNPAAPADSPLHLDGEALTLLRISRNGTALAEGEYHMVPGGLVIPDMPEACLLEIETQIAPKDNTDFTGLYVSGGNYFTQCEAQGFRRITYFPDRPDVMARYATTITARKAACPVMLSNGNPGSVQDLGDGRHRVVWTDPHPKPCYLFALVAGDLVSVKDSFTTRSGRQVQLA
ncbi:MAG TPA: aminopeptidase N, partial [Rhodopila sp.]|nr:aminopeptidase N [Rhodopila sp.]